VHRSRVLAVAHSVAGVVAVDVDRLYSPSSFFYLNDRLLAAQPAVDPSGNPVGAELLLLDPDPLDWLKVMT
jgi:hypothetical protein